MIEPLNDADVLADRVAEDIDDHFAARVALERREFALDEVLDAHVLQPDGVDHASRSLHNARSGVARHRLQRDAAHIPVIALSANAMPRDIAKGLKAGFFRYLTKPIKVKEFMDTLNAALEFAEKQAAKPITQDK